MHELGLLIKDVDLKHEMRSTIFNGDTKKHAHKEIEKVSQTTMIRSLLSFEEKAGMDTWKEEKIISSAIIHPILVMIRSCLMLFFFFASSCVIFYHGLQAKLKQIRRIMLKSFQKKSKGGEITSPTQVKRTRTAVGSLL